MEGDSLNHKIACYRKDDGTFLIHPTAQNARGLGVHVHRARVLKPSTDAAQLGHALREAVPFCDYAYYDAEQKNPHLIAAGAKSSRDFAKRWHHVLVRVGDRIEVVSSKRFKDGQNLFLKDPLVLAVDASDEEVGLGIIQAFERCFDGE